MAVFAFLLSKLEARGCEGITGNDKTSGGIVVIAKSAMEC